MYFATIWEKIMKHFLIKNGNLSIDFENATIKSLKIAKRERLAEPSPLFKLRLLRNDGEKLLLSSTEFTFVSKNKNSATYACNKETASFDLKNLTVTCFIKTVKGELTWKIAVTGIASNALLEWVDYPCLTFPTLIENDASRGGKVLLPYNEGALISNEYTREKNWFRYREPEFPSEGLYTIFPNMLCSQFISYLWSDFSLYIGAHDRKRGIKHIDYKPVDGGVALLMRVYCGLNFGQNYSMPFPIVTAITDSDWTAPCDRYRKWFTSALPKGVKKITENENLPAWYKENPLIVAYPVRGVHDMDEMKPNALYPYINALPVIDEIQKATNAKIMALLMHWEGSAPWAPPYVWPPYGGTKNFLQFHKKLKEKGNLLGVYCSGFGYTIQSNLIAKYNMSSEYEHKNLSSGMCSSITGEIKSTICTAQRQGYDICPVSKTGKRLLKKAYTPLFKSGIDYSQILDQNHGGGQYFCYSKNHNHPPAPGEWMTKNMQSMLSSWNKLAPNMLFGCESSASEPFIGNLLFSDNRFELNYLLGRPVPVFAYLYHEYLRNFMGNQVCNTLSTTTDTLRYRIAYSFSIGDSMTVVLSPNGDLLPHWGYREKKNRPDKQKTLRFIKTLTDFYHKQGKPFLDCGKMIRPLEVICEDVTFDNDEVGATVLPKLLTSAWEDELGNRVQFIVNPFDEPVSYLFNDSRQVIEPLSAISIALN